MATSAFDPKPSVWMPDFFKYTSGVDQRITYPDSGLIDTSHANAFGNT